jgi:hypothetical protein
MSSNMALDNFLPHGEPFAATPQGGDDVNELAWMRTREFPDVEDKSTDRSPHALYAPHSVTLWDEISPVPRNGLGDADDD